MNIKQLSREWVRQRAQYDYTQARLLEELEQAKRKFNTLKYPQWVDLLIKPIADELIKEFPDWHYEILGSFGIGHRISIYFYKNGVPKIGDNCRSITLEPTGLSTDGSLSVVDYSKNTDEFESGTVGAMNGLNHPLIEIQADTPIRELLKYVK